MRIGLFGGTFNPIHYGHLRAAIEVQEGFNLEKLYIIPSALPPHKDIQGVASANHRIAMARLAIENQPNLILSDVEVRRAGPSYTIDTVQHFKDTLDAGTKLFLIMVMDAFLEIDTWKFYKQLFQELPMIIMTRPLPETPPPGLEGKDMTAYIETHISDAYRFSEKEGCYHHETYFPVYRCNISMLDISGTQIRNLIRQNKSIRFLVPEKVEKYIDEQGIYI